jgi:lysozyme
MLFLIFTKIMGLRQILSGWLVQLLVVAILLSHSDYAIAKTQRKKRSAVRTVKLIDCSPSRARLKYYKRKGVKVSALNMKVSKDGQKLIKWFEKLRLTSYPDFGVWSIGWGSRASANYPYSISSLKAEELFQQDIKRVQKCLNQIIVRQDVKQHEFDAIASWVYNVGEGAAISSTLIRKYNLAEPEREVASEFLRWVHVTDPRTGKKIRKEGLMSRREAERKLFLTGKLEFF